ncbi:MAG TPA: DMT family transporter [Burkholderiales bacterium]|nr:DMT family transporter [Burkholderiales bacterium]
MTAWDAGRWLLLATLWSVQYLLMRVSVPVFGTALVAESRALFSALFLVPWTILAMRQAVGLRAHWKDQLAIGVVNNLLPFVGFAWAATVLPASYLAVMNGMVPLWSGIVAAPVLKEPLGARRVAGFVLGLAGVALIVNLGPITLDVHTVLAALAGLAATFFWGWAGVLIRQRTGRVSSMSLATGSIVFAALLLSPAWATAPGLEAWTVPATVALVSLGALCSGIAYLPFFTLVRDIGPTRTLTVGLAIPALGILWGWLFLGETVTLSMLAGTALVLVALVLVMKH